MSVCVFLFLLILQRGFLISSVCWQQKMKRSCVLMTRLEGTELLGAVISTSETYIKNNSPHTLNLKHCYCQHFPAPTNYRNFKETVGHVRGSETEACDIFYKFTGSRRVCLRPSAHFDEFEGYCVPECTLHKEEWSDKGFLFLSRAKKGKKKC